MSKDYYCLSNTRGASAYARGRKLGTTRVKPHDRAYYERRSKRARKDRLIEGFADKFTRALDSEPITKADVNAVIALMKHLDDLVLGHQKGGGQWAFVQQKVQPKPLKLVKTA